MAIGDLPTRDLAINAQWVGKLLLFTALGLVLLHIICMFIWYKDLLPLDDWLYISFFDLDEEESLGTWFSTLALFLAGTLSIIKARYPCEVENRWHYCWWILGIGFIFLSLDEVAGFHEFLNTMLEETHWTRYGALAAAAVGLSMIPFLMALPARTRTLFVIAGALYVGGALGIEAATIWHEENGELDTLGYNLWTALEEFLEMTGINLYIYALISHLATTSPEVQLQLKFDSNTST